MKKIILAALGFMILNGCKGSDGATGPTGLAGTPGISAKITQLMNCFATVSGLTGAAGTALNGLDVAFEVYVSSGGDVFSNGSIANSSFQVSGSTIYSSTQSNAATGLVIIVSDYATPNSGFWQITGNRTAGTYTWIYTDSSLGVQSPVTRTSTTAACTVRNF